MTIKGMGSVDKVLRGFVDMISKFEKSEGATWLVGTGVEYAVSVEFGTDKQEAQPFLRTAVKRVLNDKAKLKEIERRALQTSNPVNTIVKLVALEIERVAKQLCPVDTGNLKMSIEAERIG